MARSKKKTPDAIVPVRFPLPLLEMVKVAKAALPSMSEQDIIRLATEIGLHRLKRLDYKIAEMLENPIPSALDPPAGIRPPDKLVFPSPAASDTLRIAPEAAVVITPSRKSRVPAAPRSGV